MEALLPFVLIFVLGWLLLIRPQRRRQQEMARVQAALAPGTQVMLAGGLYATIVDVQDDTVLVEPAPGLELRYMRQAVLQVTEVPVSDEEALDVDGVLPDHETDLQVDTQGETEAGSEGGMTIPRQTTGDDVAEGGTTSSQG